MAHTPIHDTYHACIPTGRLGHREIRPTLEKKIDSPPSNPSAEIMGPIFHIPLTILTFGEIQRPKSHFLCLKQKITFCVFFLMSLKGRELKFSKIRRKMVRAPGILNPRICTTKTKACMHRGKEGKTPLTNGFIIQNAVRG